MQHLQVTRSDGVVTVTLDKPEKKNAIDEQMWQDLADIWTDVRRNPGRDRAVVLTGAPGAFCSGADLTAKRPVDRPHPLVGTRLAHASVRELFELPVPTIAKIRGDAVGAGFSLALCCDLSVATEESRFSAIFSRRGLSLDAGLSWLLPRIVGLQKAKELSYFGDILSADDAAAIGLVNRVVPDGDLDAIVDDWAARLAAGPPLALSLDKSLLNNAMGIGMGQALEDECRAQAVNLRSEDGVESVRAFRAGREPSYRGH